MKGQNNPAYRAMMRARETKALKDAADRGLRRLALDTCRKVRPVPVPVPEQLKLEETTRRANRRKEWKHDS